MRDEPSGQLAMTEVLFYQLQRQPLEAVLPALLERSLQRGWRCIVQAGSEERVRSLDDVLWTYADDSFLPHGMEADDPAAQPILLTTGDCNPNDARVRFLVDGAALPSAPQAYERIVLLFDGNDADALQRAREDWKTVRGTGLTATFWQQNGDGRWEKRA